MLVIPAYNRNLRNAARSQDCRFNHPLRKCAQFHLRSAVRLQSDKKDFTHNTRLRGKYRHNPFGQHTAQRNHLLAHHLACFKNVGSPVKFNPNKRVPLHRCRAHAAHIGSAVYRSFNMKSDQTLHFFGRHAMSISHYSNSRSSEIGEHIHIHFLSREYPAHNEQNRAQQYEKLIIE
ncbi:hypothetical protein SDC9_140478 [bioreactor metagenome]|uniref:HIT domain-containing protein n=1 Tax=bioreactor metagenome TaxID=1076179 RepID=A0A645DVI3_9ZZZZ